MSGFAFVGEIEEGQIKADVYFNGNVISISGRVCFTLDEWQDARKRAEYDRGYWVGSKAEWEELQAEERAST